MHISRNFLRLVFVGAAFGGAFGGASRAFAQPGFAEVYRFELEMNQQSCTRPDGADYVCGQDDHRAILEVFLDRVAKEPLEDEAFEGRSEPTGLSVNAAVQYLPQVVIRKSIVAGTSIYTLRFSTRRNADGAPSFETVYIEEGNELTLTKKLTLMADRMEKSPRYFTQIFSTLGKL